MLPTAFKISHPSTFPSQEQLPIPMLLLPNAFKPREHFPSLSFPSPMPFHPKEVFPPQGSLPIPARISRRTHPFPTHSHFPVAPSNTQLSQPTDLERDLNDSLRRNVTGISCADDCSLLQINTDSQSQGRQAESGEYVDTRLFHF